jgi:hypothetical protein
VTTARRIVVLVGKSLDRTDHPHALRKMKMFHQIRLLIAASVIALPVEAFQPPTFRRVSVFRAEGEWTGEVVADGRIRGCVITPVSETDFTIQIDGNEADLGNFGAAVYKKITSDAKTQRFQGFRPGTIPPHLMPAYKTFAMDEVARETILEAMQQNNIRPFSTARSDMLIEQIYIPEKKPKKGQVKGNKKKNDADSQPVDDSPAVWMTFNTMKEALTAGWEVCLYSGAVCIPIASY